MQPSSQPVLRDIVLVGGGHSHVGVLRMLGMRPVPGARITVICGNDVLAIGALQAAQRVGRRVPGDLSVAGFDDMPFARVVSPPLTTVRFPIEDVGSHAARYLLARLAGGTPARRIELPIELVVRASTGRARRDA